VGGHGWELAVGSSSHGAGSKQSRRESGVLLHSVRECRRFHKKSTDVAGIPGGGICFFWEPRKDASEILHVIKILVQALEY